MLPDELQTFETMPLSGVNSKLRTSRDRFGTGVLNSVNFSVPGAIGVLMRSSSRCRLLLKNDNELSLLESESSPELERRELDGLV